MKVLNNSYQIKPIDNIFVNKEEKRCIILIPFETAYTIGVIIGRVVAAIGILTAHLFRGIAAELCKKTFLSISNQEYNQLTNFKILFNESEAQLLNRLKEETSGSVVAAVKYFYERLPPANRSWQRALEGVLAYHEDMLIDRLIHAVHTGFYLSSRSQARDIKNALLNIRKISKAYEWVQRGMVKMPAKIDKLAFDRQIAAMPYLERPKAYIARGVEKISNLFEYGSFSVLDKKSPYTLCQEIYNDQLAAKELVQHMKKRVFSRLVSYDQIKEESKPFYERFIQTIQWPQHLIIGPFQLN